MSLSKCMRRKCTYAFGAFAISSFAFSQGHAQQTEQLNTRSIRLTLDQNLSATSNQALSTQSAGTTSTSDTRLGFEIESVNELNSLSFSASTNLEIENTPDNGSETDIESPRFSLEYARNGAFSDFSFSSNYRSDDLTSLIPLIDFVDDDGVLVLPEDISDLSTTGRRITFSNRVRFDIAKDAPLSFELTLSNSGRRYEDITTTDLFDTDRQSLDATTRLRFDDGFDGAINISASRFDAEDTAQTQRDRSSISFELNRALSPVLDGQVSIGHSRIETTTTGGTTEQNDTTGSLRLTLARPNGELSAEYNLTSDPDGQRHSLEFDRSLQLPNGNLTGSIGVTTRDNDDDVSFIGSLSYNQALPSGSLSLTLSRSVRFVDEDSTDQDLTAINATHTHQINRSSSISLQAGLTDSDDTRRISAGVSYNYELTEDWNLSSGYNYTRLQDTSGDANRSEFFVGLQRAFDIGF
ncbi:MAG: hypothetical protein ABJ327_13235 [Litoreibacter sp.]